MVESMEIPSERILSHSGSFSSFATTWNHMLDSENNAIKGVPLAIVQPNNSTKIWLLSIASQRLESQFHFAQMFRRQNRINWS